MDNTMDLNEAMTTSIAVEPPIEETEVAAISKSNSSSPDELLAKLKLAQVELEEKETLIGRLSGTIKRLKRDEVSNHQQKSTLMVLHILNVPVKVRKLQQELQQKPNLVNIASIQSQWQDLIVWRQKIINEVTSISVKYKTN